jgi:Ca2+-binding RTX toxin-like protein
MTAVTVLGASGTIAVPFKSSINASFAQQLANQITSAVQNNTLTAQPYNPSAAALPTGGTENELVIGGIQSTGGAASGGSSYTLPSSYVAIVNNANAPVTIQAGDAPVAKVSVLAGTGGTTFYAGASSVGGSIFVGGGLNTIAGSTGFSGALNNANGGLSGDWLIGSGNGTPGSVDGDDIYLSSGQDTVAMGGGDTVHAGGANVLGLVTNTDGDPTFFIGSAPSTVFGLAAAGVNILGNDGATGGGVYVLGTGGDGVIAAGGGASTLVGGGSGDTLYASTMSGAQAVMYAGGGNETLQGGYSGGSSTLYGGSGNDVLAGGSGDDVIAAGSGTDSIYTGLGTDSVWFYKPVASDVKDTITDFDPNNDTLILQGYTSHTVTSQAGAPLTITLSDSSTITFLNLTTSQAGSLKITNIT